MRKPEGKRQLKRPKLMCVVNVKIKVRKSEWVV
jgi:hypothetical protein